MACNFYELQEPTSWAEPPKFYSYSTLQALHVCPRKWQLLRSAWGKYSRFPERPQPSAIEGQIVHEAISLLARELGLHGRPPIASDGFNEAITNCGFWDFFPSRVDEWNLRLASHPRAGPYFFLRSKPRDLANKAIRLFREQYIPELKLPSNRGCSKTKTHNLYSGSTSPLSLLLDRGSLSEIRLQHKTIPVFGIIDLVSFDSEEGTRIIDFKTGDQKPNHKDQVLFYSLLWWRVTGDLPRKVTLQYLNSSISFSPSEKELERSEKLMAGQIEQFNEILNVKPSKAKPGNECGWCPVRARCNEGWAFAEPIATVETNRKNIDIEITIASETTPNGFIGVRQNGEEIAIVFDSAVGRSLPPSKTGDRFRILDAARRERDGEVVILPWTEMYLMQL